ncbi:DNA polymerase III subunit delta [Sphingomonas radiodurans]|uniref:DNA polymerase III subunit delta n=1 Tax=Sphingomonas radiodurans TaxID=2890321 RepID=UPI001E6265C7|nr:DNA polymerase III subunit delta [Sphingomonas radiodurans]WBH18109.1 DNA polymerase III subunit delta [Sphingomonas radiodurans]
MKATEARLKAALDRPPADIRLYLLFGPDEAGAMALADRLGRAMGADAERIDLDGATLRSDPARLADEATSLSLFGTARYVRVTGVGEESLAAVSALLEGERAGNPVVMIAPSLKATAKVAKLALDSPAALALACYVPGVEQLEGLATQIARDLGLRLGARVARRLAQAGGGDRAIMTREIEKLALYLDAAPERPATCEEEALDAVGADLGETEMGDVIEAVVAAKPAALGEALRRMDEAGVSPIPWLRALARRLASLAEMKSEVAAGGDVGSVMKRHRVFFKEEAGTGAALRRWSPEALVRALDEVRRAERALMAGATAGDVLASQAMLGLITRLRGAA